MFGYLRAVGEFSFDTFLAISGTRTVFIQKTWLIGDIGKSGGMQSDIAKSASLLAAWGNVSVYEQVCDIVIAAIYSHVFT